MFKKLSKFVFVFLILLTLVGCGKTITKESNKEDNANSKSVQVIVYDKENKELYDKTTTTEKKYLVDVLKSIDELELKTQDSDYGEYIISIKGVEQADNYYWNYYVNGEYAQVGISSQEVKNDDVYTFKLEKYE